MLEEKSIKMPFYSYTIKIGSHVFTGPCIGRALQPYYRRFLPVLKIFIHQNHNSKDRIDFDRVGRLSDVIEQTLMVLERYGGQNAYMHIKYAIPTYESCVNN